MEKQRISPIQAPERERHVVGNQCSGHAGSHTSLKNKSCSVKLLYCDFTLRFVITDLMPASTVS